MTNIKQIGLTMQYHRQKARLSQSELAKLTDIKQQSISQWENGIYYPNIIDCIKLANFYGISIDYLIGYENEDGSKNQKILNSFNNNAQCKITFK